MAARVHVERTVALMDTTSVPDGRTTHMPGLSGLYGLRGIAIIAAVGYHYWPEAIPGGLVAVSLFFTLSGYLITATLLHDKETFGRVSVRRFWIRRVRRLMPGAVITLAGVVIAAAIGGWYTAEVRRDVLAAAFEITNWVQISTGKRYGVETDTSPLVHFWSLSIEEQFYLVYPLVFVVCRTRARLAAALSVLIAASVFSTFAAGGDPVVVYYSTFTRSAEILAGALAAVLLYGKARPAWTRHLATSGAAVGVAALTYLAFTLTVYDARVYQGGLLALIPLSLLAVVGASMSKVAGPALDVAPLRWIGQRSYGMYLFHWPLYIGLKHAGVSGAWLPWGGVVLTVAISAISFRWYEWPIRRRQLLGRHSRPVAIVAFVALVGVAAFAPVSADTNVDLDLDGAAAAVGPFVPAPMQSPPGWAPPPHPVVDVPVDVQGKVRFAFFGDSRAVGFTAATKEFFDDQRLLLYPGWSRLGCPLGRGGKSWVGGFEDNGGDVYGTECDWTERWGPILDAQPPLDVAVVYYGAWDAGWRSIPALGSDRTRFGDPKYDAFVYDEMNAATDLLVDRGVGRVVWLTSTPNWFVGDQDQIAVWNALLQRLEAERPDEVSVVDLGGFIEATGEKERILPDGVHTSWSGGGTSVELMELFLADEIVRAAELEPGR
jgi:peptidoglycan/LPS O-acetylase OafA/YrhL